MNFQIKIFVVVQFVCSTLSQFSCQSNRCEIPIGIRKNILSIELLADYIIIHKNEMLIQNESKKSNSFRYECGKNQLPNAFKNIDSICVKNNINSFYISNENEITFFLKGQSDFFKGQIIERKLFFSVSNEPTTTYEDSQVKNICYKQITNKTWYIEDEISN